MSESNNKSKIRYELDFSGIVIGEHEPDVKEDKLMTLPNTSYNHYLSVFYHKGRQYGSVGILCIKCNEKIIQYGYSHICVTRIKKETCDKCKSHIEYINCPYKYYNAEKDCIMVCCGFIVLNADLDVKIRYENAKCSENHELKMCKLCYKNEINYNRNFARNVFSKEAHMFNNIKNDSKNNIDLISDLAKEWCEDCILLVKRVRDIPKKDDIDIIEREYTLRDDTISKCNLLLGLKGLCQKMQELEDMIEFVPGGEQMLQAQQRFEKSAGVNDNK